MRRQTRSRWSSLLGIVVLFATLVPAGPVASSPAASPDPLAQPKPAPILGLSAPDVIPDRYIVVLKPDNEPDKVRANALSVAEATALAAGVMIHFVYDSALDGFAATLPADALAALQNNPDVAYIEADQTVTMFPNQSPATWGLDRIDQRNLPLNNIYTYNATGAGVKVYIIDTGIRTTHNEFGGRAVSGFDAVDGGPADDCNGHGTHVSGTVGGATYGVAKGVTLVAVRVLNCNGAGTNSGVIAGINWVTADHAAGQPAAANMSLGGGPSSALDTALSNSIADGVTYAVAAGNSNDNACNYSPARVPSALTVGATTNTDARAVFSNYGTCLDLFAPGQDITSAWNTSNTATNTIDGTSMASPHVAGAAALYLQANPGAAPATVMSAILNSATVGVVTNPGTGSPNRLLYSLLSSPPCTQSISQAAVAPSETLGPSIYNIYLPIVFRNACAGPGPWQTIMSEGFESTWPSAGWTRTDPGYEQYYWGQRNCRAATGSNSAWAMGAGSIGAGLGCGASYINGAYSWMIYGPFSLAGATAAQFSLRLWLYVESGYDDVCMLASLNAVSNYNGTCYTGTTGGVFADSPFVLNLASVPNAGNLTGQSNVWIAVLFRSDSSIYYPEGAYVDDLRLSKCSVGCAAVAAETIGQEGVTSYPVSLDVPDNLVASER